MANLKKKNEKMFAEVNGGIMMANIEHGFESCDCKKDLVRRFNDKGTQVVVSQEPKSDV